MSTELAMDDVFRRYRICGWRRQRPISIVKTSSGEGTGRVTPDFVFPGQRVAVFVDACFWHGCPLHVILPKTNTVFWMNKIQHNKDRDRIVRFALRKQGWTVIQILEHSLTVKGTPGLVRRLRHYLENRGVFMCSFRFRKWLLALHFRQAKNLAIPRPISDES